MTAIGIVAATVDVAQGLCRIAFTTTRPSTAIRMIMMAMTPIKRDGAADRAELVARHLAERAAVAADRAEQRDEVLHAAAEHGADQDPQRAGQIAELRRERRADQRARARDGGEVMTEHDPAIRRHEVAAVAESFGRRGARRVEREHLRGEKRAVEAIAERVDADGGDDEPHRFDAFAAIQSDGRERERAERDDARSSRSAIAALAYVASLWSPSRRYPREHAWCVGVSGVSYRSSGRVVYSAQCRASDERAIRASRF